MTGGLHGYLRQLRHRSGVHAVILPGMPRALRLLAWSYQPASGFTRREARRIWYRRKRYDPSWRTLSIRALVAVSPLGGS